MMAAACQGCGLHVRQAGNQPLALSASTAHSSQLPTLRAASPTKHCTAAASPTHPPAEDARREAAAERGVDWCAPAPSLLASSMSSMNSTIQSVTTCLDCRRRAFPFGHRGCEGPAVRQQAVAAQRPLPEA